tara:strand:+ start:55 stop:180 length:126 start_codon:yes stop_codon:yes gene_type:complete
LERTAPGSIGKKPIGKRKDQGKRKEQAIGSKRKEPGYQTIK